MRELKLLVETDWPLGSVTAAERVLLVLAEGDVWTPDRFGLHEPLRGRFEPDAPHSFVDAWSRGSLNQRVGSFHFQKRQRFDATVMWWNEGDDLDSLHITFKLQRGGPSPADEYLDLAHRLFEAVNGQYGHLCDREEYWSKNVIDAWTGRTGRPEGGRSQGTNRREHLPGIYWANFFGPRYVDFFGADRIASAPAFAKRQGPQSWVLLTSEAPHEWNAAETVRREALMREHLGSDAFFLLREPMRATRAPVIVRVWDTAS